MEEEEPPVVDPLLTEIAYNEDAIALAAKYAERKEHVEQKAKAFFEHVRVRNNLWFLCFMDGTASMGGCLKESKKAIETMVRRLRKEYSETNVMCGAVVFRDPLEAAGGEHKVLPFGQVREFVKFMETVEAFGGGDRAEDVAGGLELAIPLLDRIPAPDTVFWAHVSDSYPHGIKPELPDAGDNHNTFTQRRRLSVALDQLVERSQKFASFEYHYFLPTERIERRTRCAVDSYKELFASKLADPALVGDMFKLCPYYDLKETFMNSIYNSVSMSIVAGGGGGLDSFAPATHVVTSNDIFSQFGMTLLAPPKDTALFGFSEADMTDAVAFSDITLRRAQFPRSRMFQKNLQEYARMAPTLPVFQTGWSGFAQHLHAPSVYGKRSLDTSDSISTDVLLFMTPTPLGRGRERAVCHGMVCEGIDDATKREILSGGGGEGAVATLVERLAMPSITRTPAVFKFSLIGDVGAYDVDAKIAIHTVALWCASSFNRLLPHISDSLPTVEVLSPFVIEFNHNTRCKRPDKSIFVQTKKLSGIRILGEFSLQETPGAFQKRVNNDGARSHQMDGEENANYATKEVVLDLLNLATTAWSGLNLVLTDLQGIFQKEHFVLTDLAIASKNKLAFEEVTNTGAPGVQKVVREARYHAKTHASDVYEKFLSVFDLKDDYFSRV